MSISKAHKKKKMKRLGTRTSGKSEERVYQKTNKKGVEKRTTRRT